MTMSRFINRPVFPLALVMLVAAGLRLPLLYSFDVVAPDGVMLIEMAKTFATGEFFTNNVPEHHHEPLYPAIISAVSAITRLDYVKSGQIASLTAAVAAIYLVYRLSKRLYGPETGIYSALILSLVPLHAFFSVMVLKESLYVLLTVAVVYSCALAMEERGKARFVMAGLFMGLAYLTRFDGVLLLLIIPFLYYAVDAEKMSRILLAAAAAFTLYAAYASILYFQTGEVTISKKLNYYVTPVMAPDAARKKLLRDYGEEKAEVIIKANSRWSGFLLKRTEGLYKGAHYMLPTVFPVLLMLLAGVALGAYGFGRNEMLLLFVPALYLFVFPYMKYPNDYRYFLCITPFLSILAGRGFALAQHGLAERHRYLPTVFILIFLLAFAPWALKPLFDGRIYGDVLLQKETGLYIRDHEQKKNMKIVSPFSVVSFYAGAEHFFPGPLKTGEEMIGLLKKTGADYAVLQDNGMAEALMATSKKSGGDIRVEKIKEISGGGMPITVLKVLDDTKKGGR